MKNEIEKKIQKQRRWSKEELNFLIENYKDFGPQLVSEALNRTKSSVKAMSKELGCNKKHSLKEYKPGFRFGQLTIIRHSHDVGYSYYHICKCDCGNEALICQRNMGRTKSCGCLQRKTASEKNKISIGENAFNLKLRNYKSGAKIRNIEFSLTKDEFKNIIQQDCFHCGQEPKLYNPYINVYGETRFCHKDVIMQSTIDESWICVNGIDRLDNNLGYTIENSVPCCKPCNESKKDRTVDEFYQHNKRLFEFQQKKNK